jgi:hypothetical protein
MPVTQKKGFFYQLCIRLRGCEETISHTSSNIEDVGWCDWHFLCWWMTEHHLSSCDVSIIINDGIIMLWHFRTNSCEGTVSVSQILELWFSCFRSHHSFCAVPSGASVDRSSFINITQIFVDVYPLVFLGNKELYHSTLFVLHIIYWLHCEVATVVLLPVRNFYNFVYKCWKLQIRFV